MTGDTFAPLRTELDLWAAAGRKARLWLRDDDATRPTPALDRLLALTARHGVPVTLAVVPAPTDRALADRLATEPHAEVAVHGWAHLNHAPEGTKKRELGPDRPPETVLADLSRGLAKLARLHGPRLVPVLVPPWNRISVDVIPRLPDIGFRGLSTFGDERADTPLPQINTHADLIDWRGTRGGRAADTLAAELAARLTALRKTGRDGVAGLLTHHLDHDEAAWSSLSAILSMTAAHPGGQWVRLHDALGLRR
jgi:peptidoglycan/xylan/chitin deacetylase (PgdA/CDA1 family)